MQIPVAVGLFATMPEHDQAAAMKAVAAPIRAINAPWQPTRIEVNRRAIRSADGSAA